MNKYRLSKAAKEDLRRIYAYGFQELGESQADWCFYSFFEAFDNIAASPLTFQSVDHIRPDYRRCVCGADSIYFRISNGEVEIMAILAGQDTEQWL